MLVSGRMARAFSKMAEKSSMDALAGSPSRCLRNKLMGTEPQIRIVASLILLFAISETFLATAPVVHITYWCGGVPSVPSRFPALTVT